MNWSSNWDSVARLSRGKYAAKERALSDARRAFAAAAWIKWRKVALIERARKRHRMRAREARLEAERAAARAAERAVARRASIMRTHARIMARARIARKTRLKREADRVRFAAWYANPANKASVCARGAKWREDHPEQCKRQSAAYYAANREKVDARTRAWYAANPERGKTFSRRSAERKQAKKAAEAEAAAAALVATITTKPMETFEHA